VGTTVTMKATLQGLERPYPAGYDVPLTLKLYSSSENISFSTILALPDPLYEFTTADNIGEFVISAKDPQGLRSITFPVSDMPAGIFNVTLYSPSNLVNFRDGLQIVVGMGVIDMGTLLAGDAKDITEGSKSIDFIGDFMRFAGAYESGPTWNADRWNPKTDFDKTDFIDVTDFSMLYTNYGELSPHDVTPE